jgi:hypothetical protein
MSADAEGGQSRRAARGWRGIAARRGGFQRGVGGPLSRRGLSRNRGGLLVAAMVARRRRRSSRSSENRTGGLATHRTGHSRAGRKVSGRSGSEGRYHRIDPPARGSSDGPRQGTNESPTMKAPLSYQEVSEHRAIGMLSRLAAGAPARPSSTQRRRRRVISRAESDALSFFRSTQADGLHV